jgi:DNA modification methylase
LKRAGDLRYRRPKEKQKLSEEVVIEKFKRKIESIIEDLDQNERPEVLTECIGEDALTARLFNKQADLVVTSPPYLNGTNYARNTKLELWLLEFVESEDEFFNLHHKSLSSGINHVFKGKETSDLPSPIMKTIGELKRVAYDGRIPLMVHQYFSDMKRFFDNLSTYILPSGSLLIDIGDSIFCGIHIPTPEFTKLLAEESGFHFGNSLKIRSRRSRGAKEEVGEYLLQFNKSPHFQVFTPSLFIETTPSHQDIEELIGQFQDSLPYKAFPYSKRNWGHRYHSLCSYQSKLKPAIAHFLIKWFTKSSDVILDPFGGVGTLSLEAKILGRSSITVDLSPTAYIVAKAKIQPVAEKEIGGSFNALIKFIKEVKDSSEIQNDLDRYSDFGFNKKLKDYYHPETFKEILAARRWLQRRLNGDVCRISVADSFIIGCLLHVLHGNRPYSLSRRSHPITPFAPTGPFEYRPLKERLWKKIERTYDGNISSNGTPAKALYADSCRLSNFINSKVNVIITSPPFIHSTKFHTNNWIRNWFCGWGPSDFSILKENFVEVIQEENLDVYHRLLEEWDKVLKEGGLIIFHLGTSKDCDMVKEIENRIPGTYEVLGKVYEFVRDTETHGLSAQGRTIRHGFLFLKKK